MYEVIFVITQLQIWRKCVILGCKSLYNLPTGIKIQAFFTLMHAASPL